jgi:hypothetical protein
MAITSQRLMLCLDGRLSNVLVSAYMLEALWMTLSHESGPAMRWQQNTLDGHPSTRVPWELTREAFFSLCAADQLTLTQG